MTRYPFQVLPVILASASPRRIELLRQLIDDFEVDPAGINEEALTTDDAEGTALQLAIAKAREVGLRHPGALVIGGDTVVVVDRSQLAKPRNGADAARMLKLLSGRTHRVITGVCLLGESEESFAVTTEVEFRDLTVEEIETYASTAEPLDKAGGYAIQGGASLFVASIGGSVSNVIGLPLEELGPRLIAARLGKVHGSRCGHQPANDPPS